MRHLHILHGLPNPLTDTPRLELVLKGIQRIKPRQGKPRLPITPIILGRLKSSFDLSPGYDSTMLWAACCLAFFGFLRCGEFTVASGASFDRAKHLAFQDISVDSHFEPTVLAVRIKASKTDQFGKGMTIFLGKAPSNLCPVTAVLSYIAVRGPAEGPLFTRADGHPLTRQWFVDHIHQALSLVGIDASAYNGHSFRIGAATTAAAAGISESLIKTLGRWSSAAYELYIRIPREQLATLAQCWLDRRIDDEDACYCWSILFSPCYVCIPLPLLYCMITEYFKEILLGEDHPCSLIIGSLGCSPSSMLYRMPGLRPGRMESYPRELQGSALCRLLLDTEPGASGC